MENIYVLRNKKRTTVGFSSETMQARIECMEIFKVVREKKY